MFVILQQAYQRVWEESAALQEETDKKKVDVLKKELQAAKDSAERLISHYRAVVDSAKALAERTVQLSAEAEAERVSETSALEADLEEAQKPIKDILKEFRTNRESVKSHFNAKLMAATKKLNNPDEVRTIRERTSVERKDSVNVVRDLKNQRIAAFNQMHGSIGWVHIDGHPETTEEFYDPFQQEGSKFLQSNILTINTATGHGALYTELFHDYIGPVRIGFGGLLSNAAKKDQGDTTELSPASIAEDQAQRVLGGGGNTVATVSVPLVGYTSPGGTFMFRCSFQPKLALDLSNYQQDSTSIPFHSDLGFELHTNLSGSNGLLSFFGSVRPSILIGNPEFYDNLQKGDLRSIALAQVRFGMGIGNVLRISYAVTAGDAFVQRTFPGQLTVTVLTAGMAGN